ncbi:MAG: response regulator [Deltaproteobacteria bacterium]|nr:response regulator [Deltaproteobacteria bacterium]
MMGSREKSAGGSDTIKILLVEDSLEQAFLLRKTLAATSVANFELQFDVAHVESLDGAMRRLDREKFSVILLDLSLPDSQGLDTLRRMRQITPGAPIVVLTGLDDEEVAVDAVREGAQDYLVKGEVDGNLLVRSMRYAIARKRSELQIQLQLQRTTALRQINQAITSTLDLPSVLDLLLENIDEFLPYSVSTVRLASKESGEIEPIACRNLDEQEWKKLKGRLDQVVYETRAPLVVSNVQKDPRAAGDDWLVTHGLRSYLGVPLMVKGRVLGVLAFFTCGEHDFNAEEVEFLSLLANHAAMAIHNSQLYEETVKLADELRKSTKVKDEFLSVMSHELRTPLTVIVGYTGMMQDRMLGEINPRQEEALERVMARSADLLSMINMILLVTSVEADKINVENSEIDLNDLLQHVSKTYSRQLGKDVTFNWDYPADLPKVITDRAKVLRILDSLISNAVKFTKQGKVTISVRYVPDNEKVVFTVADTGIGIPANAIPLIFDKFRQLDGSETRLYGGVGLGLYIVKKFTDLLGGDINVDSEPGKGSTFTLALPCRNGHSAIQH